MRNLDEYPTVKHSGKIYFQLGLLASLIAVYFIIELETPVSEWEVLKERKVVDITEKPFTDVFTVEKEQPHKEIAKADPKPKAIAPKPVVNQFKPIENNDPDPEHAETTAPDDIPDENPIATEIPENSTAVSVQAVKKNVYDSDELDE